MTNLEPDFKMQVGGGPCSGWRKSDLVYHAVRRAILLAERHVGEPLLEQKIGAEFSCSQGTVREALMRLEQDGLVNRRGYQGTVVSQTSEEEAQEMASIRLSLELAGIRKTVGRFSKELLDELTDITHAMDRATALNDFYGCTELDREFHARLFRSADMPSLEPILRRCVLHTHRRFYNNVEALWRDYELGARHRRLLQIFAAGELAAAEEAIREHVRTCMSGL